MTYSLNFNKIKQETFKIFLPDKDETELNLTVPTKGVVDRFKQMDKQLKANDEDKQWDIVYDITAELLSFNLEHKKFTAKQVKKLLDDRMIIAFFKMYTDFIKSIQNQKN